MRKTGFEGRPIKVRLAVDMRLWGKHMGLEGIKLIACDLDGTLLHPGERELRSEAFELIDELHRRGIVFCRRVAVNMRACATCLPRWPMSSPMYAKTEPW